MKQVEVSILGHAYRLACPAGGEGLLASAVSAVDKEMTAIRNAGKVRARERIAVLAALNLAYQIAERSAAAPGHAAGPQRPAASEADLDALLRRLDDALADDGRLL